MCGVYLQDLPSYSSRIGAAKLLLELEENEVRVHLFTCNLHCMCILPCKYNDLPCVSLLSLLLSSMWVCQCIKEWVWHDTDVVSLQEGVGFSGS